MNKMLPDAAAAQLYEFVERGETKCRPTTCQAPRV